MSKPALSRSQSVRTSTGKNPASTSKPGSRNGLLPTLTTQRYTIDIDVIKCKLCAEVYKSPRVLPCGHSVCFVCLESLILYTDSSRTKDFFQCPQCGKNTAPPNDKVVKQKWAPQFPVNAVVLQLLRNASLKHPADPTSHKAFCEICLANNTTKPVVAHCRTCLEHYCDVCCKHHEKRDDVREHDVTYYVPKEEIDRGEAKRNEWVNKSNAGDMSTQSEKRLKPRDPKRATQESVLIAQTITSTATGNIRIVTKLGGFNGKAPGDTATSDFRGGAFLSDGKVVLSDIANKKIKVFDVSHKTRVELIYDLPIRAEPTHVCKVDSSTVAVLTERAGNYHIRLFTIREKILHFVHRPVDTVPLGIGCIKSSIICSFLGNNVLNRYRLSRAQQIKLGAIKHDITGNDLFRHPGAICQGEYQGTPVLYVADETEYGITVLCISLFGEKKYSVFLEINSDKPKPPSAKRTNGAIRSGKSARNKITRSIGTRKDDASDTTATGETEVENPGKGKKQTMDKATGTLSRERTPARENGRHTFRRVDDYGRALPSGRKGTKEIERPQLSDTIKRELTLDLTKLTDNVLESTLKSSKNKPSKDGNKAVERARRKPVGKVVPQPSKDSDLGKANGTISNSDPNSTVTSNGRGSTAGTVAFLSPPKLVYRADSIAVDRDGNVYVCMASANKVTQMSADGRGVCDILSEKDGLIAPKIISFSPSNDMFFVTCLKSNRVLMFRMK